MVVSDRDQRVGLELPYKAASAEISVSQPVGGLLLSASKQERD